MATTLAPGCGSVQVRPGGDPEFANANADLEQEVAELRRTLERREQELAARDAAERSQASPTDNEPGPAAGPPIVLADLALHRWSGPTDLDDNGADETLRLLVLPQDRDGRFLTVQASARVRVTPLFRSLDPADPADRASPALAPSTFDFTGEQWHDAYRSGLTGTHYRLDLALPEAPPSDLVGWAVSVRVTTADSGRTFAIDRVYRHRRPRDLSAEIQTPSDEVSAEPSEEPPDA
ncbi:MAG: hypothetical protein AAF288_10685 [Planctomycetota bacterium]